MRKSTLFFKMIGIFLAGMLLAGTAWAQTSGEDVKGPDFANHPLAGQQGTGGVVSNTYGNIDFSFGARLRMIPTSESEWDFGFQNDLQTSLLGGALSSDFFKQHANESGWVTQNYIRNETQIYFNTMPRDRKWSFHAALEFDRPLDTTVVDERGGYDNETSDFGLERIHGTYKLGENMRFNAGYAIWFVGDPAGLAYGDDAPGFWLDGDYGTLDFSAGFWKLSENNWDVDPDQPGADSRMSDSKDEDRDLYAGYMTYNIDDNRKLRGFYMYDRIRDARVGSLANVFTATTGATPETDAHYLGAYYDAQAGLVEYFLEGVYKFGSADNTGLAQDDYDIEAYAFAGDIAFDLDESVGWGLKPHIGAIYTSGDDDATDDELGGYTGVVTHQRFTKFGGENTIIGDGNTMLGTVVYSYLPGLYGNGTPVVTGGLPNTTGLGSARGDNPGLTMTSVGLDLAPRRFLTFKSNVNSFWWNEDIQVTSFVDGATSTQVDSGYVGTEWDNELTLALSRHTFVKGQAAVFFPGEVIEDVTSARAATPLGPGPESDDTAIRLAMEFIWMF